MSLFQDIINDEKKVAIPALITFLQAIQADTNPLVVIPALGVLVASIQQAQPGIAKEIVGEIIPKLQADLAKLG